MGDAYDDMDAGHVPSITITIEDLRAMSDANAALAEQRNEAEAEMVAQAVKRVTAEDKVAVLESALLEQSDRLAAVELDALRLRTAIRDYLPGPGWGTDKLEAALSPAKTSHGPVDEHYVHDLIEGE